MSSGAHRRAGRPSLVLLQLLVFVFYIFGPTGTLAEEPVADPSPTESAASADPSPEPTTEPSAAPEPTTAPSEAPATPAPTEVPPAAPEPSDAPAPVPGTEPYLISFAAGTSGASQAAILDAAGVTDAGAIPQLAIHSILLHADDIASELAALRGHAEVVRVEADRTRDVGAEPSDPSYADQWALPKVGWDQLYGTVGIGGSATVAILDTGIDASHPDLDGVVLPGTSVLDGSDGRTDPNGHGTWMAGIVAAETGNGAGIAGTAYAGVSILPVTVLGADGTGNDSDIIAGVVYAADAGADVILMSFSNPGFSTALQAAIDYAWASGAVLVAAAGNDGAGATTFPAGDRGVIGVAATDPSDNLTLLSNYGPSAFMAAPGLDILTTAAGGSTSFISGTSASAAMVAGAAALLAANEPFLSNGVIVGRLARNADPAGDPAATGNGRLNLLRAMADTSTDPVQPAGAAPVGDGGPLVGPYVADAINATTIAVAGATRAVASPSSSVLVSVRVQHTAGTPWESTLVQIEGQSPVCDPSANFTNGNNISTFAVTTPAGLDTYDIEATAYSDNACSVGPSNTVAQANALVVSLFGDSYGIAATTTVPSWTDSDGANNDAQILTRTGTLVPNGFVNLRSGAMVTRSNISTAGYEAIRLDYLIGQNTDNDTSADGSLVVQWKLSSDATWTTLNTHNLANNQNTDPITAGLAMLGPSAANTSIDIRFWGNTPEDNDQAKVDDAIVSGTQITNSAPTATVNLTPANPTTNQMLTATATKADADGDPVTLTFVWKNGTTVVKTTSNTSSLTDTLDLSVAGNGNKGDTITVEVTPNDGTVNGTTATDSETVANSPPSVAFVAPLVSSANEGDTKTFTFAVSDDDGDTFSVLTPSFPDCGSPAGTYVAGSLTPTASGGTFQCTFPDGPDNATVRIQVKDSDNDNSNTATQAVTIANVAPIATDPSLTITPLIGMWKLDASFKYSDFGPNDTQTATFEYYLNGTLVHTDTKPGAPSTTPASIGSTFNVLPGCYTIVVAMHATDMDGADSNVVNGSPSAGPVDLFSASFQAPIKDNERNVAKFKNVVPIKVQLTSACTGGALTSQTLHITIANGNATEADPDTTPVIIGESVSNADTGTQMRPNGTGYIYNFNTSVLGPNKDYTIRVRLNSSTGPIILQAVFMAKK